MRDDSRETGPWIRRFHPAPEARTRLVCFPHAGGSATYYFPVARALSPAIDVLAIQYPGRQDRRQEPCVEDIEKLADLVVEELGPWKDLPLTLFGHSMGATLAFEVARRLEAAGTSPVALFASGRRAPSRVRDERVHLADDDRLIADITQLSGTDAAVLGDPEILRMILPAIRSDYKAAETYRYRPGPPLGLDVVALVGDTDQQVTVDEAAGWREHTTGSFELKVFPGGHFYLDSHVAQVLDLIRARTSALTVGT
ncbi:thioesterase II family protein [Streptomyces sp. NBC_00385]|uniref:thioesterase II family protein n=1 Tax=Streptomyces sp. NBC_00385 TaxID=2975733 RepID=UPI002DDB02B1|nr:alpha/beta fold hydrolase [Streptomyces sp. NBC_00385]WRZ03706.1 alpha/beta fold hydrolase [Streptomyces sp. NBC_00385]